MSATERIEARATPVVERQQTTKVPAAFFDAMVESLEGPSQPIEELASAVRRHRSAVTTE